MRTTRRGWCSRPCRPSSSRCRRAGTTIPESGYLISFRTRREQPAACDHDDEPPGEGRPRAEPANDRGGRGTQRRDGVGQRRRSGPVPARIWNTKPTAKPGGDAAQQLGTGRGTGGPSPARRRSGRPRSAATRRRPAPCAAANRAAPTVSVLIDPSGQVGGRDHDMGAAAAGAASASQPHPRPAPIPAANGTVGGCVPAAAADHRTRTGACPPARPRSAVASSSALIIGRWPHVRRPCPTRDHP